VRAEALQGSVTELTKPIADEGPSALAATG